VTIEQFLLALRGRLGTFALVLLATVLVAASVSVLLPKSYKASVALLVDAKDEQSLNNALRPLVLPQERLSYLQTQADILASRKVARKVVEDLKLAQGAKAQEDFAKIAKGGESIEDWLAEGLLKNLKVETSQSSVIQASFTARDPRRAAQVANGFAKAYADTMLELRVGPTREAAAWFDEQLKSLRANLENAQAKLTNYHQREGIVSSDERYDVENARLVTLSEEATQAQGKALEWESRAGQARKYVAQGRSPERLPDVVDSSFVQKLKSDLLHGEAKLQQMSTQYGINHPEYQRQLSENRSLRERLDAEMKTIVDGMEGSVRLSRQREVELAKAVAAQRSRLLRLKENRNEFTVLKSNVASAERAYDTAMQRFVANQVDSRASQANVTVLNPAVVPSSPSNPKVLLNVILSVVVGTMLGLGVVFLMEIVDRRVRSPADLVREGKVPLLAVLNSDRPARLLERLGRAPRALPSPG
jgi:succinoglycan biosynthesis transport protein ExoP